MNEKKISTEELLADAAALRWELGDKIHETLMEAIYQDAARIAQRAARFGKKAGPDWDRTLDWLFTSPATGFPIMLALLAVVLWVTITGANIPSDMISGLLLDKIHPLLK